MIQCNIRRLATFASPGSQEHWLLAWLSFIYTASSILLRFIFTYIIYTYSILKLSTSYVDKTFCIKRTRLFDCYNLLFRNYKKYIAYLYIYTQQYILYVS